MNPILTGFYLSIAVELWHSFLNIRSLLRIWLLDLISVSKKIRELVFRCHLIGFILFFSRSFIVLEAVNRFKKGLRLLLDAHTFYILKF